MQRSFFIKLTATLILGVLGAFLLLMCSFIFFTFTQDFNLTSQEKNVVSISSKESTFIVGNPINFSANYHTSLSVEPYPHLSLELPSNLIQFGQIKQTLDYRVNDYCYEVHFQLIPMLDTIYEKMFLSVKATSLFDTQKDSVLILKIPDFTVINPPLSDTTLLLGREIMPIIEPYVGRYLWAVFVIVLFIIIIGTWIYLRKEDALLEAELEPWVAGENELIDLQNKVKSENISNEKAVAKLTDIMRHYLTKRFELRAEFLTTIEFFAKLEQSNSPLADEHKAFLIDFLKSADLVKFAGVEARADMVLTAIARALKLVYQTIPVDEMEAKNG